MVADGGRHGDSRDEDVNPLDLFDSLEDHRAVRLSPVERLLLATDGTVTHMLEALTRGAVDVDILNRWVDGATLHREVALRRGSDGSVLAWAHSRVSTYPLETEMESRLVEGHVGIGDLLREEYAETRRELVGMDVAFAGDGDLPRFVDARSTCYLERTYRVYGDGQRLMSITEWFPKGMF
jgi:chorismate-pyruvate lyase